MTKDAQPITWEELIEIEPALAELLAEIRRLKPKPNFCANDIWYGYNQPGFKKRMCELVGFHARKPQLRTMNAYNVAYDKLYEAMPDCQHDGLVC